MRSPDRWQQRHLGAHRERRRWPPPGPAESETQEGGVQVSHTFQRILIDTQDCDPRNLKNENVVKQDTYGIWYYYSTETESRQEG